MFLPVFRRLLHYFPQLHESSIPIHQGRNCRQSMDITLRICMYLISSFKNSWYYVSFNFYSKGAGIIRTQVSFEGRPYTYEEIQYVNILMKKLHVHFTWYFIFRICLFNLQKKVRCCAYIKNGYMKLFFYMPFTHIHLSSELLSWKRTFSNFSCTFLNPNNFFRFEF